ncbi:hypothetical protein [Adhaeribacter terreus]|uniref:Uncharacterized protein n=1 Tax=Adhaeribacter terreus TaxID=529703 RepID=A0ABW0EA01_9BACT
MEKEKALLILFMFMITAVALIFWGWMKSILQEKGYKAHFIGGLSHFNDYPNFLSVIMDEQDKKLKKKYKRIFWANLIAVCLFILTAYLLVKQ